ncbi:MAG TPA: hypothetical protein VFN77_05450 [Acetobacteraceae bacterium]|nr:hypothetical protein [Acetobacteraceae bacterium]
MLVGLAPPEEDMPARMRIAGAVAAHQLSMPPVRTDEMTPPPATQINLNDMMGRRSADGGNGAGACRRLGRKSGSSKCSAQQQGGKRESRHDPFILQVILNL